MAAYSGGISTGLDVKAQQRFGVGCTQIKPPAASPQI